MAKKAELLEEAKVLGLPVTTKNTIAELEAAIKSAPAKQVKHQTDSETAAKKSAKTEVTDADNSQPESEEAPLAKAGKRSAKAIAEVEEKIAKEERKATGDTSAQDPEAEENRKKGPTPITRPRVERRGKKYQEATKLIEKGKAYGVKQAVELAVKTSTVKFDASLEVHTRLGVDPRQADQNIRATVTLPHGTGKDLRVAVFAPESEHAAAKKAGADIVGDESLLKLLDKEQIDFDVLVATPQYMPKLSKYARLLGPKGLMPNPKSGTVSADVAKAVNEAKAGKVEYRVDKQATIHLAVGKISFGADKLEENLQAFLTSLQHQKPSSLKGNYILGMSISSTMGPGIKVDYK